MVNYDSLQKFKVLINARLLSTCDFFDQFLELYDKLGPQKVSSGDFALRFIILAFNIVNENGLSYHVKFLSIFQGARDSVFPCGRLINAIETQSGIQHKFSYITTGQLFWATKNTRCYCIIPAIISIDYDLLRKQRQCTLL